MAKTAKKKKKRVIKVPSYKKEAIYFLIKFFIIMGLLFFLQLFNPVNQKLIIPFTGFIAWTSSLLLNFLGIKTVSSGTLIASPQFSVDIKAGCNGIEPIIILLAAIFAFRSSWKAKFYGALLGIMILQGINLLRVVSLVYIGINHPKYFDESHTYIWQIVIIGFSLLLWMAWARGLMEPHGQARGTSISSAESAEGYPPTHKASEGYPFRIHPRLKPRSSAKADKE